MEDDEDLVLMLGLSLTGFGGWYGFYSENATCVSRRFLRAYFNAHVYISFIGHFSLNYLLDDAIQGLSECC